MHAVQRDIAVQSAADGKLGRILPLLIVDDIVILDPLVAIGSTSTSFLSSA